jgi:hypothetical protein
VTQAPETFKKESFKKRRLRRKTGFFNGQRALIQAVKAVLELPDFDFPRRELGEFFG